MHEIMQRLEVVRRELNSSKRTFAIERLSMTEDSYSNWLKSFPVKPTKKSIEKISEVLGMSIDETRALL